LQVNESAPVDDAPHLSLDDQVVVREEWEDGLDVCGRALVAIDDQLVVVAGLQDDVKDRLVELVLDQKVGAGNGKSRLVEQVEMRQQV